MNNSKVLPLLTGFCITIMLACDTLAFKTVVLFDTKFSASGIIFPASFFLLGIITNSYGYRTSGRIIWYMMTCQFLFVGLVNFIVYLSPETNSQTQHSYYILYNHFWRVILSSSIAVSLSYFLNDFLVSFLKIKIKWLEMSILGRILIGAIFGNALLVLISYPINFYNILTFEETLEMIIFTWLFKIASVFFLLPFLIPITNLIKKLDKADAFDYRLNYNPLKVFKNE